jgi:hypothetical protein
MFWAFLITLVCVGIPVGGAFALLGWRALLKSRPPLADPGQVAAARFAGGEIDEAEYAHILQVLAYGPSAQLGVAAPGAAAPVPPRQPA